MLLFLKVNFDKETTFAEKAKRIDYAGNLILITSVTSMLLALSWGGTLYTWSSYHILVPLILGFAGLGLFHTYEATIWCKEPTLPPHIFTNRTTAIAIILGFIHNMLLFWVVYFLPIYFQGILGSSSARAGVQLLPTVIMSIPIGIVAGVTISSTGRYRPIHFLGFALIAIGLGLFTILDENTSVAEWVIFQLICAIGLGLLITAILPAVQVDLPEKDVGHATAAYAFMKSYGAIWGVSIPSAIFNSEFSKQSYRITDIAVREQLSRGNAYSFVNARLVQSFPAQARIQVVEVFGRSLRLTWQVSIAFAVLSFFLVFVEKEIKMRTTLETEYGLAEKKKEVSPEFGVENSKFSHDITQAKV